jgi:hypothetical protein
MDSVGKFWFSLWSSVFVFLFVMTLVIAVTHHNRLELLAKAPNPVALACAENSVYQSVQNLSVCQMYFNSIKGQ